MTLFTFPRRFMDTVNGNRLPASGIAWFMGIPLIAFEPYHRDTHIGRYYVPDMIYPSLMDMCRRSYVETYDYLRESVGSQIIIDYGDVSTAKGVVRAVVIEPDTSRVSIEDITGSLAIASLDIDYVDMVTGARAKKLTVTQSWYYKGYIGGLFIASEKIYSRRRILELGLSPPKTPEDAVEKLLDYYLTFNRLNKSTGGVFEYALNICLDQRGLNPFTNIVESLAEEVGVAERREVEELREIKRMLDEIASKLSEIEEKIRVGRVRSSPLREFAEKAMDIVGVDRVSVRRGRVVVSGLSEEQARELERIAREMKLSATRIRGIEGSYTLYVERVA